MRKLAPVQHSSPQLGLCFGLREMRDRRECRDRVARKRVSIAGAERVSGMRKVWLSWTLNHVEARTPRIREAVRLPCRSVLVSTTRKLMLTKSLLFSEERKCEEYCMYSEKDQVLFTASLALFAQRHALQGDADGLGV